MLIFYTISPTGFHLIKRGGDSIQKLEMQIMLKLDKNSVSAKEISSRAVFVNPFIYTAIFCTLVAFGIKYL